jgi:mRNA interferase RelE/StbE
LAWIVSFSQSAKKSLKALDRPVVDRVLRFLDERVVSSTNPRESGKALGGDLSGFWRYRVGDYRILCEIKDDVLVVLIVDVAHRKDIYKSN